MDFEDRINNLNNPSFVDRRLNQIKYIIFESFELPKDDVKINVTPRANKSPITKKLVDCWNLEIDIIISTDVHPNLFEVSSFLKTLDDRINQVFTNFGVNQFLEIIKNPNKNDYTYMPMVTNINFDENLTVKMYIDYDTIAVDGAIDL